jgi:hypothetical protein
MQPTWNFVVNWLQKLPGYQRTPAGLELRLLRLMPSVWLAGTLLPALIALAARYLVDRHHSSRAGTQHPDVRLRDDRPGDPGLDAGADDHHRLHHRVCENTVLASSCAKSTFQIDPGSSIDIAGGIR